MNNPILQVQNLKVEFATRRGTIRAVDGVSLDIEPGKTLGLVGESGCGKTTLGRAILRLIEPRDGRVVLNGEDVTAMRGRALKQARRHMQIVFQDPFASLSPRRTVGQILREPLDVHGIGPRSEREGLVRDLLDVVGLPAAAAHRYPHEFSGGQRQRVGIARALAVRPKFVVADEAVSALDVSVQSQILNLIADLQAEFGIAFLFISHDLAVVQHVSHHVAVMYLGGLVEQAEADDLYREPKHPYTQALLSAVPQPDPQSRRARIILPGDVPSPVNPPQGCPFHPRCPKAMAVCREKVPRVFDVGMEGRSHKVKCHLYE